MPDLDPSPVELISDPLSNITRIERRNLLLSAAVGLMVSKGDLVPTQIAALGISFSTPAQSIFVIVIALTVIYFLFAFIVYGLADFFVWRMKYQDYLELVERHGQDWSQEDQLAYDKLHEIIPSIQRLYGRSKYVASLRIVFEFILPIVVGLYVLCSLLFAAYST